MDKTLPEPQLAIKDETTAPPDSQSTALIQVIERVALNPDIDVDKMERLLDMQERIINKQAEAEFNIAMGQAQAEMGPVATDMENKQTKSKYASYAQIDHALRPIYTKHGFSLSFDSTDGAAENHVRVLCYVGHQAGYTRTYRVDMPADGKGAQGANVMTKTHATGSAFSYGQRYLLKLIFNVAIGEFDDDGNGATSQEGAKDKWSGPLKKTALRQADRDLQFTDIPGCTDISSFQALLHNDDTKAIISQMQRDMPDLWYGNAGRDILGLAGAIEKRERELRNPGHQVHYTDGTMYTCDNCAEYVDKLADAVAEDVDAWELNKMKAEEIYNELSGVEKKKMSAIKKKAMAELGEG